MRTISWLALGAAALAIGCASGSASSSAEPHGATVAGGTSVMGSIQNYTDGTNGQKNGFVLSSGQRVSVPESMGNKVSDQFPPNTSVRVTGHMVNGPDGRPILEADEISNPTSHATLDLTAARAAPATGVPSSVGGSGTGGTPDTSTSGSTTTPTSPGQLPPTGR